MTTKPDYSKIYTHAPEQHPNLILGSLQLFFWMFFHPTAFKNHLRGIHCLLDTNISLIIVLRRGNDVLKNPALWKFILQSFVILSVLLIVLAKVIVVLFLVVTLSMPLQEAMFLFLIGFFYGFAGGVLGSIALGIAYGIALGAGGGVVEGVRGAVLMSVAGAIAVIIDTWRLIIFHPLLITWNFLLYRFEQGITTKKYSLLGFNPVFWDLLY